MLIHPLDAAHLAPKRGAEIAPPSNNVVVDTLSLDASHDHGLVALSAKNRCEPDLCARWIYAEALYKDDATTLDDLREAVTTLEEIERTARRVLGGAHPLTPAFEAHLKWSRAALAARQTPPRSA